MIFHLICQQVVLYFKIRLCKHLLIYHVFWIFLNRSISELNIILVGVKHRIGMCKYNRCTIKSPWTFRNMYAFFYVNQGPDIHSGNCLLTPHLRTQDFHQYHIIIFRFIWCYFRLLFNTLIIIIINVFWVHRVNAIITIYQNFDLSDTF